MNLRYCGCVLVCMYGPLGKLDFPQHAVIFHSTRHHFQPELFLVCVPEFNRIVVKLPFLVLFIVVILDI